MDIETQEKEIPEFENRTEKFDNLLQVRFRLYCIYRVVKRRIIVDCSF